MNIKYDINFLDKPLWFQTKKPNEKGLVWTDIDGYIYRTGYKLPEKMDMLILLYMLFKSQQAKYKKKLTFTRYEIIKECNFVIDSRIYKRLEDSLSRWNNVTIEFKGTFYDGKKCISMGFHIIDSYKIRRDDGKLEVTFNSLWLEKIKESEFCKYINFNYYKMLKRPISRRLFEILCKIFKGRNEWKIDLVKLGKKLTLSGKKIFRNGKEIEVLYPSAVLAAIIPAIKEINKLAENRELLKALKIKPSEAFKLSYKLSEDKKMIIFEKVTPEWIFRERNSKGSESEREKGIEEDATLTNLFSLLKSQAKTLKEAIKKYYSEKGSDYVKWNILYANEKATKNYGAFLKKCLKEDWGADYREEEGKKEEGKKTLKKEKAKKNQEVKEASQKWEELKIAYEALEQEEIKALKPLAIEKCVELGMLKDFIPKIVLMEKIVELHQENFQKLNQHNN